MAITIIFWILIVAYVIPSFIFGFQKLSGEKSKEEQFIKWGYPLWFMRLLGAAEIIGSGLMLFVPTRIYDIAIFPVILAGAVYIHLKFKDPKGEVMTPIIVGAHLLAIFLFTFWV